MRKIILTVVASLLSCSALSAFWPEAADSALEIGAGYRCDNLQFKIQANPNTHISESSSGYDYGSYSSSSSRSEVIEPITNLPIFSSVLDWTDLNIAFIEGRGKYVTCDNFYIRGGGDYGWICSGKQRDSDYTQLPQLPNQKRPPRIEYSRSRAHTKGHVYDADIAFGYEFQLCDDSFTFSPLIGYSWKGQHVQDTRLVLEIGLDSHGSNKFGSDSQSESGLHSSYKTRWNGPFIGFDSEYRHDCEWSVVGSYEYHWGQYHAKGLWNLREDLPKGFNHRAKSSYGHVFDLGLKWDFCECWTAAIHGGFQYFRANSGRDRAEIEEQNKGDINVKVFLSGPLKKVQWYTTSISFDLGMVF